MALAIGVIIAIILIKYKPIYKVTLDGEQIGYVNNRLNFNKRIEQEVINMDGKSIDFVEVKEMPKYEFKLVNRNKDTNEDEILVALKDEATIMYKYYAVILNEEVQTFVETIEDAEQTINKIKEEHTNTDIKLDLRISTEYTQDIESVSVETIQVAQAQVEQKVTALIEEDARSKNPVINGIVLAKLPVKGIITSRFGAISSRRSGAHTGTDIACSTGTDIMAVASGTVTFAGYDGSYGYVIRIDHGNGVETWYAHCNELYVTAGQVVKAGDVIAAVGSTGNSSGPHLHLEIRVNGNAITPQKYLYK